LKFAENKRIIEKYQYIRRKIMAKFEVYPSKNGYRWRLKAGNGEVVATGEEYSSKEGAVRGCEAVQRAAADADVVEVDK
jgi:uncharacterized protein YegP (UPF0339 family)